MVKYYVRVIILAILFSLMFLFSFNVVFAQLTLDGKAIKKGIWKNKKIEYVERQIAVKLKSNVPVQNFKELLKQHQVALIKKFNKLRWGLIEVPADSNMFSIIEYLENNPMIEAIELNGVIHPAYIPNDPHFPSQWSLRNTGQTGGTQGADIDAPDAWSITRGSSNVIIGILDSGIPLVENTTILCHPELADTNRIILGWDCIHDEADVRDVTGHGTHIAGIIGAKTGNAQGIAGIAGGCKLLIVQILGAGSGSTWIYFQEGVIYAVDHGAKILNCSIGRETTDQVAYDAVTYARDHNVLIVAAAGNRVDTDYDSVYYPAAYSASFENVIAVGKSTHNDERSIFSRYGSQLNVVAPGGGDNDETYDVDDIYSTLPNYPNSSGQLDYGYMSGTSMATPVVAAIAGLMLSVNPSLTPIQIRNIIQQTTDKVPGMNGNDFSIYYGYGRVNAYMAVKYTVENGNVTFPSFAVGWSLVSVPREQSNYDPSVVFPGKYGDMFAYNQATGDYEVATTLVPGLGYWVYYLNHKTIAISGAAPSSIQVRVDKPGWIILGSLERPVLVSSLLLSDGAAIFGDAFRYDPIAGDYQPTTVINASEGVWIYVTKACMITIP